MLLSLLPLSARTHMRKAALGLVVGSLALLILVPVSLAADPTADWGDIDWRQFAGDRITVAMNQMTYSDPAKLRVPAFEEHTGIKVDVIILPEAQFRQKRTLDLSSGTGDWDAIHLGLSFIQRYVDSGWLEPLDSYLNDPALTDADWLDFDDFFPKTRAAGHIDGNQYVIPLTAEHTVMWYRKDLFDKLGLSPPSTFVELVDAAARLMAEKDAGRTNLFPYANRSMRGAGQSGITFLDFLWANGLQVFDEDDKPLLATPEAIEMMDLYTSLLKQYAPPGVGNWTWYEITEAFAQDTVAMAYAGNAMWGLVEDPEKSKVAGKVGYSTGPLGEGGQIGLWSWNYAINWKSKNKGAAWLFVQWATSHNELLELGKVFGAPARQSVWQNDDFIQALPSSEAAEASLRALAIANPKPIWMHPMFPEFGDVLSAKIGSIVAGLETAEEAMQDANEQVLKIMEKAGYYD